MCWLTILVIATLLLFEFEEEGEKRRIHTLQLDISEFIEQKSNEAKGHFGNLLPISFESEQAEAAYKLKKNKWYLIVYDSQQCIFWNSNKINLDSQVLKRSEFPRLYTYGDDLYALFKDSDQAFLAYRLANDGQLSPELEAFYPRTKKFRLLQYEDSTNVLEMEYEPQESGQDWLFVIIIFSLSLFLFFFYLKHDKILYALIVAAMLLTFDILFNQLLSLLDLETFILYQPGIYASSNVLDSLGVLINHVLVAIPLIFLIRYYRSRLNWNKVARLLLYVLVFFTVDLVFGLAQGLVLDSTISFAFSEFYNITQFSFAAVFLIGLLGMALLFLILSSAMHRDLKSLRAAWIVALAALAFGLFQMLDADRSFLSLLPHILFPLLMALIHDRIVNKKLRIIIFYAVLVLFASYTINHAQEKREHNYISLFASKLVANQDLRTEYILRSFEDRLAEEFLKPEDYENFSIRKDVVENRIKRLYFSNYLEKYDLRLISFDSTGININDNNIYSFAQLDSIYNFNTKRTVSNYFYQINKPETFNGYLAKYENCDINGHYGTTFLLLQPRLIQSEFLYPEVFANQRKKDLINLDNYSYAVYFNKKLISQKGSYDYSLELNDDWEEEQQHRHHHYFSTGDQFDIIMSKEDTGLKEYISTITFAFVCYLSLAMMLLLFSLTYFGRNNSFLQDIIDVKGRYLSTRIQVSLSVVLLVGISMSVYVIWIYTGINYNQNLENRLLSTIKNIGTQIQNNVNLEQKLENEEDRQLILNEESSAFKVDINLYNRDGLLLSTTKPYLISDEILGPLMNPYAFTEMQKEQSSQLLLQEELEGSDYLSAYVPLFNGRNEVIAFLNTPYFARNEELNKQISTVLVNVVNIYFLIVLGGLILALVWSNRISKPLLLIQQKFAETEFGSQNELIVYQRDDEIGQLVKQYNKMVMELEASANKLAEQEREGAWREMAKQVAHEIKNPLTPMKLSIQHLQRAFESGRDVEELFKKTSKLLIDQIESLSTMAGEFSGFAQMPSRAPEAFNVSEVLSDTLSLYELYDRIKFKRSISENVYVLADKEQIKRVFTNLLKNALQAIPDEKDGEISIQLWSDESKVQIRVQDNGVGIQEELRKKVFIPNFSTKNSGMGLGLAISRKIVESSGGEIGFTSEVGAGTTFELWLPLQGED